MLSAMVFMRLLGMKREYNREALHITTALRRRSLHREWGYNAKSKATLGH